MSRKYELIKDGNRNRLRALRTWQVAGRTVNHGDLGGYVYDENTLSQDGGCWIFSGSYENPLIRVYGDAIVDMNGNNIVSTGVTVPFVNIGGTSEIIGAHVFRSDTETSTYTFSPADFEQGGLDTSAGASYDSGKVSNANSIRSKLISSNAGAVTFNTTNTAFEYAFISYNRDKVVLAATGWAAGAAGKVVTVGSNNGVYIAAMIRKTPTAATTPADATAAALSARLPIDSTINIINSRIAINYTDISSPTTLNNAIWIKPNSQTTGYVNTTNVFNSDFSLSAPGSSARALYLFGDFDNVQGTMNPKGTNSVVAGVYKNVKNFVTDGTSPCNRSNASFRNVMQVQDCNNFYFNNVVFPADLINQTVSAGYPVTFTRCNVPNGLFYHHPQIRNTYTDLDFSLAESELGKKVGGSGTYPLASSEVNGMYRVYATETKSICALVECSESVATWTPSNIENSYNTTIYRDAYINGRFQFIGNNVFGGSYGHDREEINDIGRLAVQGTYNTISTGQVISSIAASAVFVCIPRPLRINGVDGFKITGLTGSGITANLYIVDAGNMLIVSDATATDYTATASRVKYHGVFLRFSKTAGGSITPDDVKGITVTTYKGCKLVNTLPSSGVITIEGNNRIQDDAALYNTNIKGTSFLGGNSVIGTRDQTYPVKVEGSVFLDDNAKFFAYTITSATLISRLSMIENSEFAGYPQSTTTNLYMRGNAKVGNIAIATTAKVYMQDNANVQGIIQSQSRGVITLKDNAYIGANLTVIGDITLCGNYNQTAAATWYGKRVIDRADAPTYDDNVHTRYDF